MAISAKMVKELREMTGAGMMDCKKALTATDGNMDEAIEFLRKNGQAKAEKKAGRIAAEGLVRTVVKEDKVAAIVEVNSETDFVAKNGDFQAYVEAVAAQAVASESADIDAFLAEAWNLDETKTVKEALVEKIAVIGENLNIRRFAKIESEGCIVSYIHGGGRIGVLVDLATDVVNDAVKEAGANIAMQVAAMNPQYLCREEIGQDFIDHETEIIKAQMAADPKMANKPEKVLANIVNGKLNAQFKEICLVDQAYVKAEKGESVAKYLEAVSKEVGSKVTINKYIRFETGEGIEKKNEDFAAEVAAQMAR